MTDQQLLSETNDVHESDADAARQQRLLDAFKDGLPQGPDGLIDFEAAVHLLLQRGADLPTVMVITKLAQEKTREMQQQQTEAEKPRMLDLDFYQALQGRPRSSVVGFPPNRRSGTAPWREK